MPIERSENLYVTPIAVCARHYDVNILRIATTLHCCDAMTPLAMAGLECSGHSTRPFFGYRVVSLLGVTLLPSLRGEARHLGVIMRGLRKGLGVVAGATLLAAFTVTSAQAALLPGAVESPGVARAESSVPPDETTGEAFHKVTDVPADDDTIIQSDLKVGQSVTVRTANSSEVQYAVSAACTMSTTVYSPYRKYQSSSYWATSKVKITRSSGCPKATFFNYAMFDRGLFGYASFSEGEFTVKPGRTVTSWASARCKTTSPAGNWKSGVSASQWGSLFASKGPTSLHCRP